MLRTTIAAATLVFAACGGQPAAPSSPSSPAAANAKVMPLALTYFTMKG
jgi:hypothetical protein